MLSVEFLPKNFEELDPAKISESLFTFLASSGSVKVETESVLGRYDAGYYDSVYKIYHDLTVISIVLISKFKPGDKSYIKIDSFYRFCIQLLINESGRLKLGLSNANHNQAAVTDLEAKFIKDYALITTAYTEPNHEVLFLMGNKNTALFSSLLQKSVLDERDLSLETPFVRTVVPPQLEEQSVAANILGNLSPAVPQKAATFDEISKGILHPNWNRIPVPTWLKPSMIPLGCSFLPPIDGSKTIVSKSLKGLTWLQQAGFKEMAELRSEGVTRAEEEEKKEEEGNEDRQAKEDKDEKADETQKEVEKKEEGGIETEKKEDRKTKELDLKNLFTIDPSVDEEEVLRSALKDISPSVKSVQEQISKSLLQLNKMSRSSVRNLEVEKKLYLKIERLLRLIIVKTDVTPDSLKLPLSYKIPVTQNNYAGSLPGPLLGNVAATPAVSSSVYLNGANIRSGIQTYKTNRLSSINKKYRR